MGDLQLRLWHHLPHWHCRQLQNRWVPWATLACSQTCKKRKSKHERTFSPKKLAQKNAQTRWQWNSRQNTTNVYFLSFFKRPFIHNFASTYKKYQMKEVSMVWDTSRTMATWGPPASAIAWQRKLAQLCYLPKTKQSYAISTVHSANRPKLSTAVVLIAQTLAQLCYLPEIKHSCAISRVHSANRPKQSTAAVLIAQTLFVFAKN